MTAEPVGAAPRATIPADTTRLLLVRHGETELNREGRWQGSRSDPPLNAAGAEQSRVVAAALAELPVRALYASALRRARETAAAIGGVLGLETRIEPDLREMDHGDWEGLTRGEILARWPLEFAAFESDPVHVRRPGGDSYGDLAARIWPLLEALADRHRGEQIVIVSHGGPIRLILSRILEVPLTERERFGVTNARWFAVESSGTAWRMAAGD